ncbi:hypothetical protein [Aurantimonas coralicida]|uniref:hypothetical protein n=1 Tax=Aurantimonas coralicida TaxID=182270 RepID=UPI00239E2B13|nr:hypothetical protein [Aurantimonas coralicida]MDE0921516.1 hypothetical protein [Aurantimonas coralicida]
MAAIVPFPGKTSLALPPDQVLERAKGQLDAVVVIGQDRETGEVYVAGSHNLAETILSIERAKRALLAVADD